jgi:hypothetical protein
MAPAIQTHRRRMAWSVAAGSSVLAGLSLIATAHLGTIGERTAHAQSAEGARKQAGATTIEEMRLLVGELEAQAEVQRGQLQKTEANLRRAQAVLSELERGQGVARQNPDRPASYPQQNPAGPLRIEDLPEQSLAERTPWSWPAETATPEACARAFGDGYEVELVEPKEPRGPRTIRVRKNGEEIIAFRGHSASVFVRRGDVLYYADFHPSASGCRIVAYHLQAREELWKTPLIWIGPDAHSIYSNRVNMKLDGDHLIVYRDESHGRSIELLDVGTGRTVGHKGRRGQREFH